MAFKKSTKEATGINYVVEEDYGSIGGKLRLRLVSWNGEESKYDIRSWWNDKDGNEKCGKGITFTGEQAEKLMELLQKISK